jgi:thiol-disulfide isomerase/thioredoxin|tara:strand:- start:2823 stop:3134 length:312 start_codon:yes stop_codon:yes gene_type:complete
MTELTEDNLQEIISTNEKVIVQFGATWCGACRVMKPRVKKLAESTDDVIFIYADAEKFTESRGVTVVRNLPTFAGFVNGELVAKSTGSKIDALVELVNEVVKA